VARTGRSAHSVEHKASRLGVDRVFRQGGKGKARSWQRGWEPWELELLAEPDMPLADVAELPGGRHLFVPWANVTGFIDAPAPAAKRKG
jgi:hypothetical protein